ncbi:MAG: hypothetical protein KA387_02315 [Rubrivivax sp.]|jgi:uncharacterized integral membrane protein|nr:hypothetical protein [Rubrivivax sp.]
MKHVTAWITWLGVALVLALIALNWSTLSTVARLDFGIAAVDLPLGITMLVAFAALLGLGLVLHALGQRRSTREVRRLLEEVRRVQQLADSAESSRIGQLRNLTETEFQRLHRRLDALVSRAVSPAADGAG